MSNSPVQVILNTNDFIESWERNPGGSNKDFFENNDVEFIAHKQSIQEQLSQIKSMQISEYMRQYLMQKSYSNRLL